MAHFAYDALGRLISSQLRFDADADAMEETLKYYYDGQNAIAEYDESDNLSRRYVHGTTYVDERAMLIEGDGASDTLDTFYYLLQDLHTVAGLIKKNGTLAEAYAYDAYGDVDIWGYRDFDFDRDGDAVYVEGDPDYIEFQNAFDGGADPGPAHIKLLSP